MNTRRIKDLVLDLRGRGTTVFVTTHDMGVADEFCDRVAFITGGQIMVIDAPAVLKKCHGQRAVRVEHLDGSADILHRDFPLDGLIENPEFVALMRSGSRIEMIHTQESTLDNIFIEVTGQELGI